MKLKLNMISAALIGVAVVGAAAVTTRAQTATPNIIARCAGTRVRGGI